ncbi:hypothetical protein ACWGPW_28480 [Paenibacillus chitinolyticus]
MDLLDKLNQKGKMIESASVIEGIKAVLRHIEIAERHLNRAVHENDDDLINDVIYRTNQAFEGMLKEAYVVLTEDINEQISPFQIEKYLTENNIFTQRVMELLNNYRRNWRNPSTHNHKLFFDEQEALLAIVSVSAFIYILLDQIIETINFRKEQQEVQTKYEIILNKMGNYGSLSFIDQLSTLLHEFSKDLVSGEVLLLKEVELIGQLGGFISTLDPSIRIIKESIVKNDYLFRPDFIFEKDGQKIVMEVKIPKRSTNITMAREQIKKYLAIDDFSSGIIYFPPVFNSVKMCEINTKIEIKGVDIPINVIIPEPLKEQFER